MFIFNKIDKLINSMQLSRKGLTIQDIANEIGMSISTLNKIKSGLNCPSVDTLETIARYFGVDMNYFFDIEISAPEVKEVSVRMTDGNEYILKRFEELVAENTLLKSKLELYERNGSNEYPLPDVQNNIAAESKPKLDKK